MVIKTQSLQYNAYAAAAAAAAKSLQSHPTLCDPIDGSPPGSAAPGVLQAHIANSLALAFIIFKNKKLLNSKYTLTLHLLLIKQDDLPCFLHCN